MAIGELSEVLFLFRLRSSVNVLIDATKHLLNFRVSTAAGP
jgi:hypothetical protein